MSSYKDTLSANILTFILLVFLSGCNKTESTTAQESTEVTISGIIKCNSAETDHKIISADFFEFGSGQLKSYVTDIKNDGSFHLKFEQYIPRTVTLNYKMAFYVLVHPGDSLFIEIDTDKSSRNDFLTSLRFYGNTSRSNTELCQYLSNLDQTHTDYSSGITNTLAPEDFKAKWDSVRNELLEFRRSFIQSVRPTRDIETWTLYEIEMRYLSSLLFYTVSRQKFNPVKKRVSWDLPEDYFEFMSRMPEINIRSLINPRTQHFMDAYSVLYLFPKLYKEHIDKGPHINPDSLMISEIIKTSKDDLFGQLLLSQIFSEQLDNYQVEDYRFYEDTINKYIVEPFIKEPLNEYSRKKINNYENPELLSQTIASYSDETGTIDILKKIIKDNHGKVIYIDCFGTWCGPCLEELPKTGRLIKKYADQDISFVFLSFSSNKKRYDAIISDLELEGQHYFLNKEQSHNLSSILKISEFPHYLMIDKKGRVVQAGSHLRPGYQSTVGLIDKLLAQ